MRLYWVRVGCSPTPAVPSGRSCAHVDRHTPYRSKPGAARVSGPHGSQERGKERVWPCRQLDPRLAGSRAMREHISAVFSPPVSDSSPRCLETAAVPESEAGGRCWDSNAPREPSSAEGRWESVSTHPGPHPSRGHQWGVCVTPSPEGPGSRNPQGTTLITLLVALSHLSTTLPMSSQTGSEQPNPSLRVYPWCGSEMRRPSRTIWTQHLQGQGPRNLAQPFIKTY